MRVRFQRQDSSHSITSRASSRTKREEKRRDRHVTSTTASDDVKLPFPLEVSQSVHDKYEAVDEQATAAVDVRLSDDDFTALLKQARDSVNQGVSSMEKVIEQLQARNETLRQERDTAIDRVDELSQRCGELESHNECLRFEVDQLKMEKQQLHQQRVNEWKMRKAAEEKLIKLEAKTPREKHNISKAQGHCSEFKDITANFHVTRSRFATDIKDKEGQGPKDHDLEHEGQSMNQNSPARFRANGSLVRDHVTTAVTSETVTSLPETLRRIRREKSVINSAAMLAATYPPRPRPAGLQYVGQEVLELGQGQSCLLVSPVPVKTTLRLPSVSQRASSL